MCMRVVSLMRCVDGSDHGYDANFFEDPRCDREPRADDRERGALCVSRCRVRYFWRFRNIRVCTTGDLRLLMQSRNLIGIGMMPMEVGYVSDCDLRGWIDCADLRDCQDSAAA